MKKYKVLSINIFLLILTIISLNIYAKEDFNRSLEKRRDIIRTFNVKDIQINIKADCTVYDEHNSSGNKTHILKIHDIATYTDYDFLELKNIKITRIDEYRIQITGVIEIEIDIENKLNDKNLRAFKNMGYDLEKVPKNNYKIREDFNKTIDF